MELPFVIGHRGAAGLAPENTLAGIERAASLGVGWIEFDVRLTASGQLVLMHDETLERTTDGRGVVADIADAAWLASLDAGSWFGPAWAGTRVPVLDEALDLAARLGLGVNIEIKPAPRVTEPTVAAVVASVARCWPAGQQPPLVSSLDRDVLLGLLRRAPGLPRAIVMDDVELDGLAWLRLSSVHVWEIRLDDAMVSSLRRAVPGALLASYTVNTRQRADELAALGVDAVFSDFPDRLAPR